MLAGDGRLADATSLLKSSIDLYNAALANISTRIVIKVYETLEGTYLILFLGNFD